MFLVFPIYFVVIFKARIYGILTRPQNPHSFTNRVKKKTHKHKTIEVHFKLSVKVRFCGSLE